VSHPPRGLNNSVEDRQVGGREKIGGGGQTHGEQLLGAALDAARLPQGLQWVERGICLVGGKRTLPSTALSRCQRMTDTRRKDIRHLIDQVRRILLDQWDPLGVGGMPALADEYDFVLGKVMAGLAGSPSVDAIIDLLTELERDYLGLPVARRDLSQRAASSLAALRRASKPWPNTPTHDPR